MEIWNVIGFRKVEFTDKNTGNPVKGYSLFMTRPADSPYITGSECQKLFVSERIGYEPVLNDTVSIVYNRYGKVDSVTVC